MKGNNIRLPVLLFIWLLLLLTGCGKKDHSYYLKPDVNAADNIIIAERGLIHTFNLLLKASLDSNIINTGHGYLDKALIAYLKPTNTFNILYSGQICADSAVRSGLISIKLNGNFFSQGTVARVSFQAYSEDNHFFIGSDNLVNQGISSTGLIVIASFIDSLIINKDTSGSIRWHSTLIYNMPPLIRLQADSVPPLTITGTANGISSMNYNYTMQITSPLVNDLNCPWLRDGNMQIYLPGADVTSGTIRFMNKTGCDNRVTYDFEGNIYEWWMNAMKLNV